MPAMDRSSRSHESGAAPGTGGRALTTRTSSFILVGPRVPPDRQPESRATRPVCRPPGRSARPVDLNPVPLGPFVGHPAEVRDRLFGVARFGGGIRRHLVAEGMDRTGATWCLAVVPG